MNKIKKYYYDRRLRLILLIAVIIVSCLYFIFNMPNLSINNLESYFDDMIPRISIFAIPYLFFLPWFWGTVLYSWLENKSFKQLAYSIIIVNIIAYCIYSVFQTYVHRIPVDLNEPFSGLLKFIYDIDRPYGAFPSLHVALSSVVAVYFIFIKSKWSNMSVLLAILIATSTLFTKQHYVADVIAGSILGVGVSMLVFGYYRKAK